MAYKEDFSMRLREAITASGMSKQEIAREAQISPKQLHCYLTGRSVPQLTTFCRLCKTLEVKADALLDISPTVRK